MVTKQQLYRCAKLSFFLKIVCPKFIRTFSTCEPHVLGFDITEMRKPEKDLILLG
jgi:hypothetical protein